MALSTKLLLGAALPLLIVPVRSDLEPRVQDMPAGVYSADKDHTDVYFIYDHVGFSHRRGRVDRVTGHLTFDPRDLQRSHVEIELDPSSIDTNVAELDSLLKSSKFFDVASFPRITFHSTGLTVLSANTGRLSGVLTIRGITRPVVLEMVLNKFLRDDDNPKFSRFGFTATTALHRSDWGLGGVPLVPDTVQLTIEVEFTKDVP